MVLYIPSETLVISEDFPFMLVLSAGRSWSEALGTHKSFTLGAGVGSSSLC